MIQYTKYGLQEISPTGSVKQLLDHFQLSDESIVFDGTMGFAGHAEAILSELSIHPYVGFDKDLAAIELAKIG